jgi:hypothetical protein
MDAKRCVETEVTFPTSPNNATPPNTGATFTIATPSIPLFGFEPPKSMSTLATLVYLPILTGALPSHAATVTVPAVLWHDFVVELVSE